MIKTTNSLTLIIMLIPFLFNIAFSDDAPKLTFGAYIDTYTATDNAQIGQSMAESTSRQFAVSDNLKNELGLNIASITGNMDYKGLVRAKLTLQYGDLPKNANLYSYQNIQEAYVGYRVVENFWVDAGFFLTHIGGESLCPKDNWLSSHSMVTYYEPFFQSGVRAQYDWTNFSVCLHILNANGRFDDNNKNKTVGLYLKYTPTSTITISYAGVAGNEDSLGFNMHILNNFVVEVHPNDKLGIKGQLDYGTKNDIPNGFGGTKSGAFIGTSLQARYQITNLFAAAVRLAYFDNSDGVEGAGGSDNSKGMEYTAGVEYKPFEKSYLRLEGRVININNSSLPVFYDSNGNPMSSRAELMLNMGFWID